MNRTTNRLSPLIGRLLLALLLASAAARAQSTCVPAVTVGTPSGISGADASGNLCPNLEIAVPYTVQRCPGNWPDVLLFDAIGIGVLETTEGLFLGAGPQLVPIESDDAFVSGVVHLTRRYELPDGSGTAYLAQSAPVQIEVAPFFAGAGLLSGGGGEPPASTTLFDSCYPPAPDTSCVDLIHAPTGQVMFEDLWPANGDRDYNDAVISFSYDFTLENGALTSVRATFNALAAGAQLENGVALHIPGIPASQIASITRYASDGTSASIPSNQFTEGSGGELVAQVYPCLRESAFGGASGFINTDSSKPVAAGEAVDLVIALNAPLANFDTGAAPFDLFLQRCSDASHQIHLPEFDGAGTGATQALFGTGDDGSTSSRHFVNKRGLPWALAVPDAVAWPQETKHIEDAYPDIVLFGTSGGASNAGWYSTNAQAGQLFSSGAGQPAPTPIAVSTVPPVADLCEPVQPYCAPALCDPNNLDAHGFGSVPGAVADGSAATPYLICSKQQLQNIQAGIDANGGYAGKSFCITQDIDLSGGAWTPIAANTTVGAFKGALDGHHKTLSNLSVNNTGSPSGLFATIESASIKNLTLANVEVHGQDSVGALVGYIADAASITDVSVSGSVSGHSAIGGVIGWIDSQLNAGSTIEGIASSGAVSATNSPVGGAIGGTSPNTTTVNILGGSSTATVTGGAEAYQSPGDGIGGFIGYADSGTVLRFCYATGDVTGVDLVGGFVGRMDGTPQEVWAYDCAASGKVIGSGDRIGGFVGDSERGNQTRCYATGDVSGATNVGGFAGTLAPQNYWAFYDLGKTFTSSCAASGAVSGVSMVGGFVGQTVHQNSNNYSRGAVTATGDLAGGFAGWAYIDTRESTAWGFLAWNYTSSSVGGGGTNQGGFAGSITGTGGDTTMLAQSAAYENFWDSTTSGQGGSAIGTPLPTAQMQSAASYAAWPTATEDDWDIGGMAVGRYPILNWEGFVPALW